MHTRGKERNLLERQHVEELATCIEGENLLL